MVRPDPVDTGGTAARRPVPVNDGTVIGYVNGPVTAEPGGRLRGGYVLAGTVIVIGAGLAVLGTGTHPVRTVLPLLALGALAFGYLRLAGGTRPLRRRFRLEPLAGDPLTCLVAGAARGTDLRHGDTVRVEGQRDGTEFRVRRLELLTGPAGVPVRRLDTRPPASALLALGGDRAAYVLAAAAACWTLLSRWL